MVDGMAVDVKGEAVDGAEVGGLEVGPGLAAALRGLGREDAFRGVGRGEGSRDEVEVDLVRGSAGLGEGAGESRAAADGPEEAPVALVARQVGAADVGGGRV